MPWWQTALARVGVRSATGRDAVGAAVVVLLGLINVVTSVALGTPAGLVEPVSTPLLVLALALVVLEGGVLAGRRRAPRVVLAVALGALLVSQGLPDPYGGGLGTFIAAYTVGAYADRRVAAVALGVGALAMIVWGAAVAEPLNALLAVETQQVVSPVVELGVSSVFMLWLPGLLGAYMQTRRAYTNELVARTERLAREREERARRAVADERTRIAGELHDEAAHHLSSIIVQAGAAERIVERDPAAAREALAFIRQQGKDTLASMRQLVGVLRVEGDSDGRAPQPTLARLPAVVAQARAVGMQVDWAMEGSARPLPATVDLAAYRTVQEALSNARRHAPGAPVTVELIYTDDWLEVDVRNEPPAEDDDDGTGHDQASEGAPGDDDTGHGLVGLQERAALVGGTLEAGPRRDGGWRVRAHLPVRSGSDEPTAPPPDPADPAQPPGVDPDPGGDPDPGEDRVPEE